MTLVEFRILHSLATFGPLTAGERADSGPFTTHQAVAPMLKKLGERGLVRRATGNSWTLTAKGRTAVDA